MSERQIGRYTISGELGRGGMATVYRGYDPRFKREVAIKILPPEFLHTSTFRARFEREAQTIAALEHPAIVPVYDYGEENDQPYLVMRLMAGGSLADRLARGPLPLTTTAEIMERLAPALDRAHGLGIIHRDLKPGNILFDDDGHPYISDFGLAKLSEPSAQLSQTGVMGTPAYMAPEQARGDKQLDARADLYAMGVILYHMLTGRLPYEADTPMGVAYKHVTEPPPRLSLVRPDLPPAFDALITKAMAKDPAERFQSATAMQSALEKAVSGQPTRPGFKDLDTAPTMLAAPDDTRPMSLPVPEPPITPIRPMRPITPPPASVYTPPPSVYTAPPVVNTPTPAPEYSVPPPVYNQRPPTPAPVYPVEEKPRRWPWVLLALGVLLVAAVLFVGAAYAAMNFFAPQPTATPTVGIPVTWTPRPVPTATHTLAPGESPEPSATVAPTDVPTSAVTPGLAAGATQISPLDSMVQVYVPAGEFGMGSDSAAPDQAPFHKVTLDAFWIDQTEVTVAQYIQCVKAAACSAPVAANSTTRAVYYDNSDFFNFPVIFINWPQAKAYCESVGRRLPTEAEWEKAARGTDARLYPWGNEPPDPSRLNYDLSGNKDTVAVGSYPLGASPYGALDMAGNVSEWVADWYDAAYYAVSPLLNPLGPDQTGCPEGDCRPLRGGNWNSRDEEATTSVRLFYGPNDTRDAFGVRCAQTP